MYLGTARAERARWRIAVALVALGLVVRGQTTAQTPETGRKEPGQPAKRIVVERVLASAEVFAPGVVSTEAAESAPAFSPDGRALYFSRAGEAGRRRIMVTAERNGTWTTPRNVSFADSRFDDSKATFTADGRTMIFASNRPVPGVLPEAPTFLNLWSSTLAPDGWSEPRPLGPEINTPADEDFPLIGPDGTLWFASNRGGNPTRYRIYRSRPAGAGFAQAEVFESAIDSGAGEAVCRVAPDGRYLLFMSMRPGGLGAIDLYVSFREEGGTWGPGVNLGAVVNSPQLDWFATVTPDARRLLFASTRTGKGDIYSVDATVIAQAAADPRRFPL